MLTEEAGCTGDEHACSSHPPAQWNMLANVRSMRSLQPMRRPQQDVIAINIKVQGHARDVATRTVSAAQCDA